MRVARAADFESFRDAARSLLRAGVQPGELHWQDTLSAQPGLFSLTSADSQQDEPAQPSPALKVPRRYVQLASLAVLVRSADRFELAYRVLFRLRCEPHLLDDQLDRDVAELTRRAASVHHDEHRMHAFLRFRRTVVDGAETFVAWYEPEHFILRLAAPFFQRRFASQRWAILTPDESAFWDGDQLRFGPGAARSQAPDDDQLEQLFRTYYQATFNPARENPRLFQQHVPRAFQRNMPELSGRRTATHEPEVRPAVSVASPPPVNSLVQLAEHARACRACPLGERATQTVFGRGPEYAPPDTRLCLVGEQPGDEEDRRGEPFVGPAGKVLDRALAQASLDRSQLYLTNAVKHFSFQQNGKKRLHVRPQASEVQACRPWLEAELALLRPRVIVCLGATAAQSFLGKRFSVTQNRGRVFETPWARSFLVTYHPSAVLRAGSPAASDEIFAAMVKDLHRASALLSG